MSQICKFELLVSKSILRYQKSQKHRIADLLHNLPFLQDGNIPLFAAIEAGNVNVCRELLSQETEAQIKFVKEPLKVN